MPPKPASMGDGASAGAPSPPQRLAPPPAHDIDVTRLQAALARWPGMRGAGLRLLHVSENATYRVRAPDGTRAILRVSRPGERTRDEVRSELAFLELFRRNVAPAPAPIACDDGELVHTAKLGLGDRPESVLVLFDEAPGTLVGVAGSDEALFGRLGEIAARAHLETARWTPPRGFTRPHVLAQSILSLRTPRDRWRGAPGVDPAIDPAIDSLLERALALVRRRLDAFGTGSRRFGLIHADMYGDNLLRDGSALTVIDFDDACHSWHLYDLAASLSYLEARPIAEALRAAWLDGYLRHRHLPTADVAEADTLIMLRRLQLLAWLNAHSETPLADAHLGDFAAGSARLAERFLSRLS